LGAFSLQLALLQYINAEIERNMVGGFTTRIPVYKCRNRRDRWFGLTTRIPPLLRVQKSKFYRYWNRSLK